MRHRNHKFDDVDDYDLDLLPLDDLNEQDQPVTSDIANDTNHNHNTNSNSITQSAESPMTLLPLPPLNLDWMPPIIPSSQHHTNADPYNPYTLHMADMNQLLPVPLTEEERAQCTRDGITVVFDNERAKNRRGRASVHIHSWKLLSVLNAFNVVLRRLGSNYLEWTPWAVWDDQTERYLLDWEDITNLRIPYNREGFHFVLTKIKRKYNKHQQSIFGAPPLKKRKKAAGLLSKQDERDDAVEYLQSNLNKEVVDYIMTRLPNSCWTKFAIFFLEKQWSLDRLNHFVRRNYIEHDHEWKSAKQLISSQPNRSAVQSVCGTLKNKQECNKRQRTHFVGLSQDNANDKEHLREKHIERIDKKALFEKYKASLKRQQDAQCEICSLQNEIKRLQSDLQEFQEQKAEILELNEGCDEEQAAKQSDEVAKDDVI